MGGHERLWGAFNWYTCLSNMTAVRFLAGPYALAFVGFGSGRKPGLEVPSMLLAKDGVKVFGSRRTEPSDTEDFFAVKKLYGGGEEVTTKKLADKGNRGRSCAGIAKPAATVEICSYAQECRVRVRLGRGTWRHSLLQYSRGWRGGVDQAVVRTCLHRDHAIPGEIMAVEIELL